MNFDKSTHSNLAPLVAEFRQSSPVAGGATHLKAMANIIHGEFIGGITRTKEYTAWQQMKSRCYNPSNIRRKFYSDKGITVCERWLHSFPNFLADMGRAPSPQHSLDRIDNNGNYEPGNCRWATRLEQRHNSTNRLRNVTAFGETMIITRWSERTGLSHAVISQRLDAGWTPEDALTIPIQHRGSNYRKKRFKTLTV